MIMAKDLAGFSWAKCDKMRKVIAKSQGAEIFDQFRIDFVNGCQESKTLNKKQATELFDQIVSFSAYGFNKAHAVEYSVISYWDAWLRYYYPAEFYASCLSYLDVKKKKEVLETVVSSGLEVWLPKIGQSKATKWTCRGDKLIMPFNEIHGVGESVANQICDQNKKKRSGFFKTVTSSNIPGKAKEVLSKIKAHDPDYRHKYNDLKDLKEYFEYNLFKIMGL